jgi:hypothetical protein
MENWYFNGFPHPSKCRKMIWNLEESLNMRGRKIAEKKRGFPPKKWQAIFFIKNGNQFFSSKMVVTIRF